MFTDILRKGWARRVAVKRRRQVPELQLRPASAAGEMDDVVGPWALGSAWYGAASLTGWSLWAVQQWLKQWVVEHRLQQGRHVLGMV